MTNDYFSFLEREEPIEAGSLSPNLDSIANANFNTQQIKNEQIEIKINLSVAQRFLTHLDEEADFFTFQTFDESPEKRPELAKIFHGSLEECFDKFCDLQNRGAGIFVTINETDGKGRSSDNIKRVRALMVDLDGAPLAPLYAASIEPHMIIETSPGRYHAFWFIDGVPLESFSKIQKVLAKRFNGDPSVCDLPRVMRLVGSTHQKKEPFLTRILFENPAPPISFTEFEKKMELFPLKEEVVADPIFQILQKRRMIKKEDSYEGCYSITCPWVEEHSTGDDLGTKYYLKGHHGYTAPGFRCFHNHCKDRTIKDLTSFLNDEVLMSNAWEDPIPLPGGLPDVKSFDMDLLPDSTREWIYDLADRMQIPPDFSAAGSMVVAGSLIGRRCGINPKQKDDWLVIPNLWGAIIGRPSFFKSPAIAEVIKPLDRLVLQANDDFIRETSNWEQKKNIKAAQEYVLKEELRKAAKKNSSQESLEMIIQKQVVLDVEKGVIQRRYKTEDGTIEKIGEILNENPDGILIHRDELMGLLKSLDKYGRETDRAFYLEAWNGNGNFTVDRIGRGTLFIPALCLSILGGIQPGPLSSYVYQAVSGNSGDDGLMQRFQMTVWPDAPTSWKNVDRFPDTKAKNRAFQIFESLSRLKLPVREGEEVPSIHFDPEGQLVFNDWRGSLESRLRSGILIPCLESHLAKYRSLMPSIALILYLMDMVDTGHTIEGVTETYALRAVEWCNYLESHAGRLYSSAQNPITESAKELLKHIRSGDILEGFSCRDVYRKQWSKLTTQEEAQKAIQMLLDYGWIRLGNKKTYQIHPSIRRIL